MSQTIAVTVKGFSVTQCIDPKSKTEIPAKFKPVAISALKAVQVDPPKGQTASPYSADITVAIKKLPKAVRAEVKITFSDQDPYSKKDRYQGTASGGANVPTENPDKGDTEAAVEAALDTAITTTIKGIKDKVKNP
jgi:hypothetical protein